MRKSILAALGAVALVGTSTAANAAVLVLSTTTTPIVSPPASGTFGNSFNPATIGMFTDTYNFVLGGSALTNASLITLSLSGGNNIDFTCPTCLVQMDSTPFTLDHSGSYDVFTLNPTVLGATSHVLTIKGNITAGPSASYSGTINFNTVPVPEPATWALMLLGFAGIGMAMRRRRAPAFAQLA